MTTTTNDLPTTRPYDRRAVDRGVLFRRLKPSEILSAVTLVVALVTALGWRFTSIAEVEARVSTLERQVDSVTAGVRFTNYLLCVQLRRPDPAMLPAGCAPVRQLPAVRPVR